MDAAILLPSVRTEVRGESRRIFSIQESNVAERTTPALLPIIYIYIYEYLILKEFRAGYQPQLVFFRLSRPYISHLGDCFSWSHILQNTMCLFAVEYNELIFMRR